MWHRRVALALGILAALLLVLSGLGVRTGAWPFRVGFGMFAGAMLTGLAATGAAIVGLALPRIRTGSLPGLIVALVLGAASAAMPLEHLRRLKTVPYINDISTDTAKPPELGAAAPVREYQAHFAELQGIGYPHLRPLELRVPPAQAFARALEAARAMGLEVVAADEKAGRIEAVATTLWFGFKDDVVVRVTAAGGGSRVDARSKSRAGRSDLGANAGRIQELLDRVGSQP